MTVIKGQRGNLAKHKLEPLLRAGLNQRQIGERLGAAQPSVSEAIKRHGLSEAFCAANNGGERPAPPALSPIKQMKRDAAAANKRRREIESQDRAYRSDQKE